MEIVTRVKNMLTGKTMVYCLPADEAVVAAHAQDEQNDFNTWDYDRRYKVIVEETPLAFICGNCYACKPLPTEQVAKIIADYKQKER